MVIWRTCFIFLGLTLLSIQLVSSEKFENNSVAKVAEKWVAIDQKIRELSESAFGDLSSLMMQNVGQVNISRQCLKELFHLMKGLHNLQLWAVKFIDSSGKGIDGILEGALSSFGSYDECLDITVPSKYGTGKPRFRGQYCIISVNFPLPPINEVEDFKEVLKITLPSDSILQKNVIYEHLQNIYRFPPSISICVPSGCTVRDVDNLVKMLSNSLYLNVTASKCEVKQQKTLSPIQAVVISIFAVIGFLSLTASLMQIYCWWKNVSFSSKICKIMLVFSLPTNIEALLRPDKDNPLKFLHGMRFFTMAWIILGHTYGGNPKAMAHLSNAVKGMTEFLFQVVGNGHYAVESFLFIGAFLLGYLKTKHKEQATASLIIIHRLFRFLPPLTVTILFTFILPLLGSGPLWEDSHYIWECSKHWWKHLLLINNFFQTYDQCVPHTWYLSADFQLLLIVQIPLYILLRWQKFGIIFLVLCTSLNTVIFAIWAYVNDIPPNFLSSFDERGIRNMLNVHCFALTHLGVYCIGMLAGHLLATKPDLKLSKKVQITGWVMTFFFMFSALYTSYLWYGPEKESKSIIVFYGGFSRILWSLALTWIMICCATGHGGIVNTFLSWNAFVPLSRLTFFAYLGHVFVVQIYWLNLRTMVYTSHFILVWMFLGNLCASYMIACGGYALIETPFYNIGKMFALKIAKNPKEATENGCDLKEVK